MGMEMSSDGGGQKHTRMCASIVRSNNRTVGYSSSSSRSQSSSTQPRNTNGDETMSDESGSGLMIGTEAALRGVCLAIQGGLVKDQIMYEWEKNHKGKCMNRYHAKMLLRKLASNYPKLYTKSIHVSFRTFSNSDESIQPGYKDVEGDVERKLKPIMDTIESNHHAQGSGAVEVAVERELDSFFQTTTSADNTSITMDEFINHFSGVVGPRLLQRFVGNNDNKQGFLQATSRDVRQLLSQLAAPSSSSKSSNSRSRLPRVGEQDHDV